MKKNEIGQNKALKEENEKLKENKPQDDNKEKEDLEKE